ncbi:MAG TPA: ABC transporter permease [Myxococcales bacterium]|nr:ABC transporter permease [Myxococcales bacterium]
MGGARKALVVFRKEVVDSVRDRRSVLTALLGPLIVVAAMGGVAAFVGKQRVESTRAPLALPVVGMERAPDLMTFLRENNVRPHAETADPEVLIRSGDAKVVLVVPEDYGRSLRAGRAAPVQVVADRSYNSSLPSVVRVEGLLSQYSLRLGALRLLARGVDDGVVQAVALERVDLSTPQSRSGEILSMVPLLLVISLFMGGIGVATDSTAGERERGSLEPLLINPIPRWALVLGKLLATMSFSAGALVLGLMGLALLPRVVSFAELGAAFSLPSVAVFALLVPLMVTASGVQMVVASFARTFKEAQTTLALLNLLPMAPGVVLAFLPVVPKTWMFLVPVLSEEVLVSKLVRGEGVDAGHLAVAMAAELGWAALVITVAVRLYRSERVLFGTSA